MTSWTSIQEASRRAFPIIPGEIKEGFRSETQGENTIRMIILGAFGVLLALFVLIFSDQFVNIPHQDIPFPLGILHLSFLLWNVLVLILILLYHNGRYDISVPLFTFLNLMSAFLLISWSFFVSVVYKAGVIQDWLFIVSVFSVFALLLWSLTEMLIVLSATLALQIILIEYVFPYSGLGPGLFGISFIILAIAAALSRILYYTRVRNYIHWENIGQMNLTLKREVSMHLKTMRELEEVRQQLDNKVVQQTQHLRETNERLSEEIAERRYADKVRSILYRISTFVNGHNELQEVFGFIHEQLSSIMEVRNFFVVSVKNPLSGFEVLYEKYESRLTGAQKTNQSLCSLVMQQNKALLLNKKELARFYQTRDFEMDGISINSWLGIPLRIESRFVGILSVQSFSDSVRYDQTDMELLEYVSEHVALAISRHDSEQILITAKEKAEKSDQLKTTFLQNLSHEIRTPMNAIVGFSELFMDEDGEVADREYYASQVIKNSNYLLKLISDIIDLSKIQSGELALKKMVMPVDRVFAYIQSDVYSIRKKLEKEQLHIEYQIDPELEHQTFYVDQESFRQIMHALVENALKFTNEGGVIIGAKPFDAYRIQFFVRDTGIGIDQEDVSDIFEYFRQGTTAARQLYRGTGLGLALAKALVKEHHGEIWVESEMGTGSCFFFTMSTSEKPGMYQLGGEAKSDGRTSPGQAHVSAG